MGVEVRRPDTAHTAEVARLLYLSAAGKYDRFAGGPKRAQRLLERLFARPGTNASAEVVWVAEQAGRVAGAMSGFPAAEGDRRNRALLRVAVVTIPPWLWPGALRLYRLGSHVTPPAPERSFYVDGLATHPELRRRGAARSLLTAAEERAAALGLAGVALDTSADNAAARALYESAGFEITGEVGPRPGLPGFVGYFKRLAPAP